MENTLGKMIGIVRHSFKVKGDAGWTASAAINVDFRDSSDADIKSWLCSNRVISGQRAWAKMTAIEYMTEVNGQTFTANAIGQKVKTRAEKITTYTSMGLPLDLAEIAVDDPVKFQIIMDKANIGNDKSE